MVFGKLLFGFILGNIASTLANAEIRRVQYEENLGAIQVWTLHEPLHTVVENDTADRPTDLFGFLCCLIVFFVCLFCFFRLFVHFFPLVCFGYFVDSFVVWLSCLFLLLIRSFCLTVPSICFCFVSFVRFFHCIVYLCCLFVRRHRPIWRTSKFRPPCKIES